MKYSKYLFKTMALALLLSACEKDEQFEQPQPPEPPKPTVTNDTVRMDMKTIADFQLFQKRADVGKDSTYIADVRQNIAVDSLDITETMTKQYKDASKHRITHWNTFGIIPSGDSVRITGANYAASGNLKLFPNATGKTFYAATEQDSINIAQKGYKIPVYWPHVETGDYGISNLQDLSTKATAAQTAANNGKMIVVEIAGKLYITDSHISDLEKLDHPNISLQKVGPGAIMPNMPKLNIDGKLLAKLADLGILSQNVPNYFFVPQDKNFDAMNGKNFTIRTNQLNNSGALSWAIPDTLNLNGNVNAYELEALSKYDSGNIIVNGDAILSGVNDKTLNLFSSPSAPNSGKPLVFKQDPVIISLANVTTANDSVGNMSIQKLRASFYKQNPGFTYHSIEDYYYWKDNTSDPNFDNAIRPTRLGNKDLAVKWYRGEEFIDTSWSSHLNNRAYISFSCFEKLALYFGCNEGKIVNPSDETIIIIPQDNRYLWLNGLENSEQTEKLNSLLPACVKFSKNSFDFHDSSWPLYFGKSIRTL